MHGIDLVALIVADGDVWSLTANHGPPRLVKLGPLAEVKERVDEFRGDPFDLTLASALGTLLLPDDSFRPTDDVLYVLVDGRLAGLPVAALRRGAKALIEMRPIVRVLRLPETRCVPAAPSGHATVLAADPASDIPKARTEAEQVAALLHTVATTGNAATRHALFTAAGDAVLHVAAHAGVGNDGAALQLADGEVSALEISARQLDPSLAVLSACSAAESNDSELAGSLAAGFLGAGSRHVVATLQSITDAGAQEVTRRFYDFGGVADPPRALRAAQAALVHTNTDWPYFVVFGPDVCRERTLGRR
jgi:CHAT domain-containing protein